MATRKQQAMSGSSKSGRIEVRVEAAREKRIRIAASLQSQTVSSFILEAATEKADQIISENTETRVPAEFFDSLWKSLSAPPRVMPRMAAIARGSRRYVERW